MAKRFYCANKRLCNKCVLIKRYICEKEIQLFLDQEFCSKETQCLNKEILLGLGREVLLC